MYKTDQLASLIVEIYIAELMFFVLNRCPQIQLKDSHGSK